jgi:hypothetical protein
MEIIVRGNTEADLILLFSKDGAPCKKSLLEFGPPEIEVKKIAARWFNALNDRPVDGSLYLSDIFKVGRISLWWHAALWLFENVFTPGACALAVAIVRLSAALDELHPERVRYEGTAHFWDRLLEEVCKVRGINFSAAGFKHPPLLRSFYPLVKTARFFLRIFLWAINRIGLPRNDKVPGPSKKKKILLFAGDNWQEYFDVIYSKSRLGELHLGNIISTLKGKYYIDFVLMMPKYRFIVRDIKGKLSDENINYVPFESYLQFSDLREVVKAWRLLRVRWAHARAGLNWDEKVAYAGVPCGWWFIETIDFYLKSAVVEHLLSLLTGRRIIEKTRPDYILLSGEWSVYGLAVTLQANLLGVPVSGLQHGFMCARDFYVHFNAYGQSEKRGDVSPLPNYLLLYGDFYKNILVKYSNIPPGRCVVTGAPRFDDRHAVAVDHKKVRESLGIGTDEFVVLIAVNHPNEELKFKTFGMILSTLHLFPAIRIIAKLHPTDSIKLPRYKLIAKQSGVEVIFQAGFWLWPLFKASDLFISEFSTIIAEGASSGVSTFLIDFFRMGYSAYYEDSPLLPTVKTTAELAKIVEENLKSRTRGNMEPFVRDHLYKFDGKATERVVSFIESQISLKENPV